MFQVVSNVMVLIMSIVVCFLGEIKNIFLFFFWTQSSSPQMSFQKHDAFSLVSGHRLRHHLMFSFDHKYCTAH